MLKLVLEKAEEPEIKLQTLLDHQKSQRVPGKIYFCFTDYAKTFDCVDLNKLWKILQEVEIPDHLACLLRNMYASQEATVRTMDCFQNGNNNMEQWTGSKMGKEYV